MAIRQVLAAVLGVGLGLVLLAFPNAIIRIQMVGRVPGDRRGKYGEDGSYPRSWQLLVRGVGLVIVGFGLFFAARVLGLA